MTFGHPQILGLAFVVLLALAIFLVWAWRRKMALIAQFVHSRLLANLTVGVSYARQKLRLILLFLATAFALLAAARPQWGFDWQEATTQGLDIIVAIDTSKSMLAEDISPNRLTRAKLAAYDLLRIAKSDRFGLIAFAGTAFLQCPLTLDEQVFRQSVEALDVNIIPQGGTALSEAIKTAQEAFEKSENHKVLVLFTDGEDHDSDAVATAQAAAKEGLKIFTIGVGTQDGEMLRVRDERGNQVFLKDPEGNAIKSRLNETLLQQVATEGQGFYLPLVGTTAMESLYNRGLASLPRSESTTKLVKNYRERFYWPLGIALLLLVVELFLPHSQRRRAAGSSSANLKKAAVCLLVSLVPLLSFASPTSAYKKYQSGNYEESFADYQEALKKKTNDFRLHYNAGNAAYQAEKLEEARKHFEAATIAPDLKLQQQAYYNLGNTLYQIGEPAADPKEKQQVWEQSIKNYENALRLNANDDDAKHNLALVKQKLEELKQQQQQQQQQQSKQDQNEQNKDQRDQQEQQSKNEQNQQNQNQQDQQKQDQAKQDQQQQSQGGQGDSQKQEEQKQRQQEAQNQQGQDQKQEQQQNGQSGKPGEEQSQEGSEVAAADGKMTEQQAQQFLDAIKREERPLIFMPPPKERKNADQPLKDW